MQNKKGILTVIASVVCASIVSSVITLSLVGERNVAYTPQAESRDYGIVAVTDTTAERKKLTVNEIAKLVGPSIVGISCTTKVQSYFGMQQSESSGSGIILTSDGNIVTNNHVIEGATSIKVKLNTGSEYNAVLIGADKKTDIAVIKITPNEELHVASIGDSEAVEVGDLAVAIGNPLASELFGTVTAGVISGVNRTMVIDQREMTLIQTDAAISPGNSGGALINHYGEVIGINSVKLVDDAAEGLGFAIPMKEAIPIIKDLTDSGYVKGRPVIGVTVREITPELAYYNNLLVDHGLYVMSVAENSGAYKAGLKRGDIIVKFDGKNVNTSSELNSIRDKHKAGDVIMLTFIRAGREMNVPIALTEETPNKK
ncbi:MAG: trypsin-like peptidase domain-containing protein [Clostridia bacterium]|nr:trypsin-like peptidase domain-containing protein [Clostridia bacterium]